jgi:hypothetical protein
MADIIYPIGSATFDEAFKELLRLVVTHLKEDDFLFTVEAKGKKWDVYKANINGYDVSIYLRLTPEKKCVIGYCLGRTPESVISSIGGDSWMEDR